MDKKKLSGYENRKRAAAKSLEIEKQRGNINKYFKIDEKSLDIEESNQKNEQDESTVTDFIASTDLFTKETEIQKEKDVDLIFNTSELLIHLRDPAMWPDINEKTRKIIIENGPYRYTDIDYPVDSNGRKFSNAYYNRKLPNSELISRDWLIYSLKCNSVYCFCCKIFTSYATDTAASKLISQDGYLNWQNLSKTLHVHETSSAHMNNFKKWIDLKQALQNKTTIDSQTETLFEMEKQHWRAVIERIIEIVKFLGQQCLAFRGTSDILYERNNGNFLKLMELLAKFDAVLANHLRRVMKKETKVHYTSKRIQNEIISLLSNNLLNHILSLVRKAKYYSIILDCTPDVSHKEQMTIILRFVSIKDNSVKIEEHFVGFIEIHDSTGKGMIEYIVNKLKEFNLDIQNLRGQGYDNGANMKGKNNGLQKHILNINPRAFFVPCAAHTLNLVVNDAAKITFETINFFAIVQAIYNFFSASTKRWSILNNHISKLTLKPLSDTRWESRIDALKPLRYQIGEIYDALFEIFEDSKTDHSAKHEAQVLYLKIKDFQFLCSVALWHNLLSHINIVNKLLQSTTENIASALKVIDNTLIYIKKLRTDEGFEEIVATAVELANCLEIPTEFKENSVIRKRRKTRQFDYEAQDEPIQNPKDKFKINFFNVILDASITSIEDRYEQLKNHNKHFEFLHHLHNLKDMEIDKLKTCCSNLELYLTHGDDKDIDSVDLFNELKVLKDSFFSEIKDLKSSLSILTYICSNNLESSFPNICISLRILNTLPISVASGERSFSRLKLIKTYLRSSISQERLVGLALIAIEHDICTELNLEDLISEFASLKARRAIF